MQLNCNPYETLYTIVLFIIAGALWVLLMSIWYYRLFRIFKGTVLAISKLNLVIFIILVTLYVGLLVITTICTFIYISTGNGKYGRYISIIWGMATFVLLITIIFLIGMLIYKLTQTFKFIDDKKGKNENSKIMVITRIVILTAISLLMGLITPIFGVLNTYLWRDSELAELFANFIIVFGKFINCLCIVLSFTFYDKWYNQICGCLDKKCHQCWGKLAVHKQMEKNLPEIGMVGIKSVSSKSKSDTQTSTTPTNTTPTIKTPTINGTN